jgi:hypothetical protein
LFTIDGYKSKNEETNNPGGYKSTGSMFQYLKLHDKVKRILSGCILTPELMHNSKTFDEINAYFSDLKESSECFEYFRS